MTCCHGNHSLWKHLKGHSRVISSQIQTSLWLKKKKKDSSAWHFQYLRRISQHDVFPLSWLAEKSWQTQKGSVCWNPKPSSESEVVRKIGKYSEESTSSNRTEFHIKGNGCRTLASSISSSCKLSLCYSSKVFFIYHLWLCDCMWM